jgi:NADP-dependent 3-hydroxy acid dehydrogenase YdfG
LGAGFARALAEAGAAVVLAARRADRLTEVADGVRDLGRRVAVVTADVADPDSCEGIAQAAMAKFGRIDILVNNAGVGIAIPATRESPADFRRVIDINLNGVY